MKVAILHYHLNPGGVTRIIGSQIQGLLEAYNDVEVEVLCGHDNNQSVLYGARVLTHPALQYLKAERPPKDYESEAKTIREFIVQNAKGCILHCHNPNLGKNPAFTLAVYKLALSGYQIVNHYHDFAEDRPVNMEVLSRMFRQCGLKGDNILYPDLPNYHFIVLNTCDFDRVLKLSVPSERIHLLPNPVSMQEPDRDRNKAELRTRIIDALSMDRNRKIITYPVRGIKRKNLGEFILLAVMYEISCQFVITQPPLNPEELPRYVEWKDFCREQRIGIKFEAGKIVNHEDLIRISEFCITTSDREGFGMVYLEPWLAGTPVSGRNLPCVTDDLRKYGMKLPGLYEHLWVETDKGTGDFKDLDQKDQKEFIVRIIESSAAKEKLIRMNPFLENLFTGVNPEIIEHNKKVIKQHFSVSNYGKRLFALYKNIPG